METLDWGPHGLPLARFANDALALTVAEFVVRYGPGFLITHTRSAHPAHGPTRTRDFDDGAESTGEMRVIAYPIRRRPKSEHAFVSVGRINGNDIAIADETVSKFHAFLRETPDGFTVQDARSRNGTTVEGAPVPGRGLGPPTLLLPSQSVRFGGVTTIFMTPAGLIELARKLAR
ncbi:MAG TPA: FHA domain-containing protein [Myxococcota bacterium]|jgi:hypothetical protein